MELLGAGHAPRMRRAQLVKRKSLHGLDIDLQRRYYPY